jgi:alpha-glucoside transport system substrate-binding protein
MRAHRTALLLVATAVTAAGCTGDPEAAVPAAEVDTDVLEVFTNYRDAEADAFRAVLDDFTATTGHPVRHVGTAAFARRLPERVRDGDPPDVALVPQPALIAELAEDGHLVPLDDEVAAGLADTLLPGAGAIGQVDGRPYGAWFRLSVNSLVWAPPGPLASTGGDGPLPRTWDELLRFNSQYEADTGRPSWCLGMESFDATGWVGTDWIEDLVLRLHGPDVYDAWVAGEIPFTDPRIREAFEEFSRVALVEGRVLGGRRGILSTPVLDAVLPMLDDPPGCLLARQGSVQEGALPEGSEIGPDGDLQVYLLPGTDPDGVPPVLAAGEIAVAFDDRAPVVALMQFLAEPASATAWAERGSFTSPHATFDEDAYPTEFDRQLAQLVARAPVVRFDGSDQMATSVGTGTFWQGMVDLVAGTPLDQVLEEIQAGWDTP